VVVDQPLEKVKEIIETVRKEQSLEEGDILINCLHKIQDFYCNYVPPEAAGVVAETLRIPISKVYEVLTFYTMFSTKTRGKYVIRVCNSLPCHVTNGSHVMDTLCHELGITYGETTKDGLFTLEKTGCLGLCGVGPVMMINDQFFGNLTPETVTKIIADYRTKGETEK
jgi:NADH-quinone oxidoreductase subunit E